MSILINILLNAIAVFVVASILPGVTISSFWTAIVVAIVLGLINTYIRPILLILTLPINILTLGLFTFVIIALLTWSVTAIVPGFHINGFWWALLFAILLSIVNSFLQTLGYNSRGYR